MENNAFLSSCGGSVAIPTNYGVNKARWFSVVPWALPVRTAIALVTLANYSVFTPTRDVCDGCPARDSPCTAYLCKAKRYSPGGDANPQPVCPTRPWADFMTYDLQITARNMANYYRNLVATGWAQDRNGYTPTAKRMNALVYDCDTVGAHAFTQADNCAATSYTPNAGYVLSFYKTKDYNLPEVEVLRQAMASWFGQLKNVDLDEQATYNNNVKTYAPDSANLVRGDATKLGCSMKTCFREGFSVVVCEFDGTAPSVGVPLYPVGKTCSGCTAANKKLTSESSWSCSLPMLKWTTTGYFKD
ncbi:SCP-like protein [Ancylostoma ceylanicum]|uniref:SCP-like protein n=1 Tax=Ancylostoma ceylanicum TaxID=53326 RepID=A0A0D6LTT9_9BILA|nr:SCP-like protein [Ancylostoma ceylanicum]